MLRFHTFVRPMILHGKVSYLLTNSSHEKPVVIYSFLFMMGRSGKLEGIPDPDLKSQKLLKS